MLGLEVGDMGYMLLKIAKIFDLTRKAFALEKMACSVPVSF